MPPNLRGFYKGRKFNLTTNHQLLKILFLSHMLSKFNLHQFIKKLATRCICLLNCKLYTQTNKKLCYQTQEGFTKVRSSTWLQTSSHSKYYFYHIWCPHVTFLGSLKSQLQGASTYQILGFALKPIRSCVTKPKKVCEFFKKISNSQHYPYSLPFFQKYCKHPIYFPLSTIY